MPASEAEVADLVRDAARAGLTVRVAGAGHSFMPIAASDGLLLSADRLQGVLAVNVERRRATIGAGTRITALGEPLTSHGLALANQGDIDVQAIAGAISTGTHGTGTSLGSLSTMVRGVRLVDGRGEIVDIGEDRPDILKAAALSVGSVGAILSATLQLVPAYRLHERVWYEPIGPVMERLDALIAATRHFEFFWRPKTDDCECKALNPTDLPPDPMTGHEGERIDHAWRVFPSVRQTRFVESEWSVPAARGPSCFAAIRRLMQERFPEIVMPIEYRTVAADDLPLSPNHGRASVAISIHHFPHLDWLGFFNAAQPVFLDHGGRPHWGKWHALKRADFERLYPAFDAFRDARATLDPDGLFLSPAARAFFG